MVSFRSGSSYDRWYEGRRTWAAVQSTSRTLLRTLSLSAPATTHPAQARALRELSSLVVAFGYATMHRLRDQPGVQHAELAALLPPSILNAYAAAPTPSLATLPGGVEHSNASEPERATAALNLPDEVEKAQWSTRAGEVPSNLPLFLLRAAHASLAATKVGEVQLDAGVYGATTGALQAFTEQLTALERIRDSKSRLRNVHKRVPKLILLPLALSQLLSRSSFSCTSSCSSSFSSAPSRSSWSARSASSPSPLLRKCLIPNCIANCLCSSRASAPANPLRATSRRMACIVYYGIDKSAEEMSDPFGTEPNDLPVARFCQDVEREARELGLVLLSGSDKKDL